MLAGRDKVTSTDSNEELIHNIRPWGGPLGVKYTKNHKIIEIVIRYLMNNIGIEIFV